jgi:hypothetical protein
VSVFADVRLGARVYVLNRDCSGRWSGVINRQWDAARKIGSLVLAFENGTDPDFHLTADEVGERFTLTSRDLHWWMCYPKPLPPEPDAKSINFKER